jgi:hypothetical protein
MRTESLFNSILCDTNIDIIVDNKFGNPVKPKGWFLVPLRVIDEAMQLIKDGTITYVD